LHVSLASRRRQLLGENIRCKRRLAGLSQERSAEKADLHPVYVSAVERGVKTISVDALFRISDALKTSIRELFEGF
jgi:transcriptional regulator with XRE-family HTH domain